MLEGNKLHLTGDFIVNIPLLENELSLAFSKENEKGLLWVCGEADRQRRENVGIDSPPLGGSAYGKSLMPLINLVNLSEHCVLILEIGMSITYACCDVCDTE